MIAVVTICLIKYATMMYNNFTIIDNEIQCVFNLTSYYEGCRVKRYKIYWFILVWSRFLQPKWLLTHPFFMLQFYYTLILFEICYVIDRLTWFLYLLPIILKHPSREVQSTYYLPHDMLVLCYGLTQPPAVHLGIRMKYPLTHTSNIYNIYTQWIL